MTTRKKSDFYTPDKKIFFKYYRDEQNRPLVTVCYLVDTDKYARGVAICSPRDNPKKSTGRNIALGRAVRAMQLETSTWDSCVNRKEAIPVMKNVGLGMLIKSYFVPTPFPRILIKEKPSSWRCQNDRQQRDKGVLL